MNQQNGIFIIKYHTANNDQKTKDTFGDQIERTQQERRSENNIVMVNDAFEKMTGL